MRSSTKISLTTVTSTFVPFGILLVAALLAAETTQAPTRQRIIYSIWVSMTLALPALCLYALPARNANRRGYWLMFWTFSYVAYLVHFYYAFGVTYHASLAELYAKQHLMIATSNLIVTALWGLDVVLGWTAGDRRLIVWIRTAAHTFVFATFFVSSVVIFGGTGRLFGLAMTAAVLGSLIVRVAMHFFAHDPVVEISATPIDNGDGAPGDDQGRFQTTPRWNRPNIPSEAQLTPDRTSGGATANATLTSPTLTTFTAVTTGGDSAPKPANLRSTPIVDSDYPSIKLLADRLAQQAGASDRDFVQLAHRYLSTEMRAIYSIAEDQSASETLRVNGGSCSQRMACLEALARARGIPTRVRALWHRREFWFHRLPLLRPVLPKRALMPWPQFFLGGQWVDFSELYGSIAELAARASKPFTNRGESLFSAIEHVPLDFWGISRSIADGRFDLRQFVAAEGSLFDTRDELLAMSGLHSKLLGRIVFGLLYGGRPIRRMAE